MNEERLSGPAPCCRHDCRVPLSSFYLREAARSPMKKSTEGRATEQNLKVAWATVLEALSTGMLLERASLRSIRP